MNFIISQPELFNTISVHKFFDINIPDTKVGGLIEKYSPKDYKKLMERLNELYPDFRNVN